MVTGTATVTVTLDTANTLILEGDVGIHYSGSSGSLTVGPGAAASLSVSAPSAAMAGTGFRVTITGSDQFGNGYSGQVTLTASDNQTTSCPPP